MRVVFPMTGPNRFHDEQHAYPKPLIEVAGRTMIENAISCYSTIPSVGFTALVSQTDVTEFNIDQVIKQATQGFNCDVKILSGDTAGALCTVILAIDTLGEGEILISNYDQELGFDVNNVIAYFRGLKADFGLVSFDSVHPKWSYVRLNESGLVIESAEKKPISRHALAGLYYFRCAGDFINAAKQVVLDAPTDKKRFYVSEVINTLVLNGSKGACFKVKREQYHNFYDSAEIREFNESRKYTDLSHVRASTKKYVEAFSSKNIQEISSMLSLDAVFIDPIKGEIKGKNAIHNFIYKLFEDCRTLSFVEKNILVDSETSIIEFELDIDGELISGVDIILWKYGKISRLEAYFTTR
jgi:ketosteroid isomerase-like protein